MYTIDCRCASNIDDAHELLHLVEQHVAFLDDLLVLCVLPVRATGLHHVTHLVDLGADAAGRDEAGQLRVEERHRQAERRRHRRQHHTACRGRIG